MCVAGGTNTPMKLIIKEKCNYVCRVTSLTNTHHGHSVYIYIFVVLHGWIKSAARYYISDIIICAMQVLCQLPIKTSGDNSCIATNEAIRNFCGGYYRVDDINYLCHVRYGMFPRNKSLALVIYCGNIPNGRDITNTYIPDEFP